MSIFLGLLFGLFLAVGVLTLMQINGNQFNITIRGNRVLFVSLIFIGLIIYVLVSNFYINCDLRTGAADGCQITFTL
jgi:uncharacterized membrane protein YagU involved in acid resistance